MSGFGDFPQPPPGEFYDDGWNGRMAGVPFDQKRSLDWRDGWKDCDETPMEDRYVI